MSNSLGRYFEGFFVGGTIGFVVGLLTAPKPGNEMRKDLLAKSEDLYKQANTTMIDLKDRTDLALQDLQERRTEVMANVEHMKERVSDRLHVLADQSKQLKEKVVDKANALNEDTREMRAEVSEKVHELSEKGKEILQKSKETLAKEQPYAPERPTGTYGSYRGPNSGPLES